MTQKKQESFYGKSSYAIKCIRVYAEMRYSLNAMNELPTEGKACLPSVVLPQLRDVGWKFCNRASRVVSNSHFSSPAFLFSNLPVFQLSGLPTFWLSSLQAFRFSDFPSLRRLFTDHLLLITDYYSLITDQLSSRTK